MSNNKQSSVEWVIENLTLIHALLSRREIGVEFFNRKYNEIVEQAKAMHKEECITYAHDFARQMLQNRRFVTPEIVYNETFGGNNE